MTARIEVAIWIAALASKWPFLVQINIIPFLTLGMKWRSFDNIRYLVCIPICGSLSLINSTTSSDFAAVCYIMWFLCVWDFAQSLHLFFSDPPAVFCVKICNMFWYVMVYFSRNLQCKFEGDHMIY